MNSKTKTLEIKCPQCRKITIFSSENKFRPFCSERCRVLDLGAWADGTYRIPTTSSSSDSLSVEVEDESWDDSENRH